MLQLSCKQSNLGGLFMIMMYGTDLCPDCVAAKKALEENGIEYKYINITESLGSMKQFLKLRDTRDEFKDIRGGGSIGIPALVVSPTELTLDWEGYISSRK